MSRWFGAHDATAGPEVRIPPSGWKLLHVAPPSFDHLCHSWLSSPAMKTSIRLASQATAPGAPIEAAAECRPSAEGDSVVSGCPVVQRGIQSTDEDRDAGRLGDGEEADVAGPAHALAAIGCGPPGSVVSAQMVCGSRGHRRNGHRGLE